MRIQGAVAEIDLDDEGVRQAQAAADAFASSGLRFGRVYSSPYRRAAHTAEIVAERTASPPPVHDPRIREISFGEYEGTPYLDAGFADSNIRAAFEDPASYVPRGGESFSEVLSRVRSFIEDELVPLEGKFDEVLVVAHGGVLHAVVAILENRPLFRFWEGRQGNCCVHVAEISGGRAALVSRNSTP